MLEALHEVQVILWEEVWFFLRGDNSHCPAADVAEAQDQTLLPVENQAWAGGMSVGVMGMEMG